MSDELASVDGHVQRASDALIPATDEGLLRGDGVFEVLRVYDGRPFALADHLARLERSAHNLRLPLPAGTDRIAQEARELLERRGAGFDGALRVVVTRGGRWMLFTEPIAPGPAAARLALVTYAPTRILDGVKSLSYAANMLASRLARERGFDEALLTTPHGRILEAPTASLFFVDGDGELCTPPLDDHILASITRQRLVELTGAADRPLSADAIGGIREAFLASTTREVQAVSAIEDVELAAPGERTRAAAAAFSEHVRGALA